MNDKIKKNRIKGMTPRVHGHTKIVFIDKSGRETVKFDKDNLVTDALNKIFESNYFGAIDYSMLMPAIKKVVGGVVLFEDTLGNDGSDIWIPKSFDNKITGHAGQTVPASLADDITRGIPNTVSSVALSNGYKLVWNFPETQGNGDISAVGLCHSDFGDYALKDTNFKPLEMISNDSIKPIVFARDNEREKIVNFFDKVNGYSYTIINENATVGRTGQEFVSVYNTFKVIRRKNQLLNNIAVDMKHYLGNDENKEEFTLSYEITGTGSVSNYPLPSIYIDYTNNLLWIGSGSGSSSTSGSATGSLSAYDMTQFADGANLSPVKVQSGYEVNGAVLGSNRPTQSFICASAEGLFPAVILNTNDGYKMTLASYDSTAKEFALKNITSVPLNVGLNERFDTVIGLGNYYLVKGFNQTDFCKLFEFDTVNDANKVYDVSIQADSINPYYQEADNPIIGASQWAYSPVKYTMGNSGVALNKLYLATKNDLPNTITKTPANAMRVEYTLTYV